MQQAAAAAAATEGGATHIVKDYGQASYWDRRYEEEVGLNKFEWYQSYDSLQPILEKHLGQDGHVLQVGVGTSELQAELITRSGFKGSFVNTDISAVAVAHMQQLHAGWPQLTYQVADAKHMPEFADASFDTVIDKGTLDAIRCGPTADEDSAAMMLELYRVLRPGGVMMMITYGPPFVRLPWMLLPGMDWDLQVYMLGNVDGEPSLGHFPTLTPGIRGPIAAQDLAPPPDVQDWNKLHFVYVATKAAAAQ
ncbi:hypothetical protein OEZ85_013476 [Tetradesmus obliquus]|uniref:Methyltransferase domain-containing protein n=1 Tax=Tetradesmus obliquus TaxID=3088 RepID=A0ABY8UQE5_TETOB|nr:hypothetical protein OEZ85_013476 [Tetradesmus obliquus]